MLIRLFNNTFFKFILVGILNTIFGTIVMVTFYNLLECNYWISTGANYFFGSILSYFLNKKFTFKNNDNGVKVVIKFIFNIFICYLMAYGISKPLISNLLINLNNNTQENIAMFVGMVLFVIFNYIGQRFFTFKK